MLRPLDLVPVTDFTYKYHHADSISHLSSSKQNKSGKSLKNFYAVWSSAAQPKPSENWRSVYHGLSWELLQIIYHVHICSYSRVKMAGLHPAISLSATDQCHIVPFMHSFEERKQNHMQTQTTWPNLQILTTQYGRWRHLENCLSYFFSHDSSAFDEIWCTLAIFDFKNDHVMKKLPPIFPHAKFNFDPATRVV